MIGDVCGVQRLVQLTRQPTIRWERNVRSTTASSFDGNLLICILNKFENVQSRSCGTPINYLMKMMMVRWCKKRASNDECMCVSKWQYVGQESNERTLDELKRQNTSFAPLLWHVKRGNPSMCQGLTRRRSHHDDDDSITHRSEKKTELTIENGDTSACAAHEVTSKSSWRAAKDCFLSLILGIMILYVKWV